MQFPSLGTLLSTAQKSLFRFPFEMGIAILGTIIGIYYIEIHSENIRALLPCLLGLPLFFAATLFGESKNLGRRKYLIHTFIAAFLLLYYYTLEEEPNQTTFIRFALLALAFHLLVSFSPFLVKGHLNGFWQFNKSLFLRILTAGLFSGALFTGLIGALLAINALFSVHIDGERFGQLFVLLAGVFNTWFFLSGIPENVGALEEEQEYPKGLKIFTQYVLIPLVTIYLIILYAYEIKIISAWSLPKGWVSYLVIGYSIVGILSILLVYPIRNSEGNKWIHIFSRWFYLAIFPLVILLLIAIGTRVMQYGVTENRYFILVLTLWLLFVALYFLISRNQNIKIIPISLFFVAIFSSWGPQGASSISEFSQNHLLKGILEKNNLLTDGKVNEGTKHIPFKDEKAISSKVKYLYETHGKDPLQRYFKVNLDSLNTDKYNFPDTLVEMMGLKFRYKWDSEKKEIDTHYLLRSQDDNNVVNVGTYDYLLRLNFYDHVDTKMFKTTFDDNKLVLSIHQSHLSFDLGKIAQSLINVPKGPNSSLPQNLLTYIDSTSGYSVKLQIETLSFFVSEKNDTQNVNIDDFNGILLVKKLR